jgi:hypothetical protein
MKKYVLLAFGLLVALNLGCVLVNVSYPTISDNTGTSGPIPIVNTNGKAHIIETGQTIDFLPNGDNAELVAFVDQDAKGFHRETAYQIVSTGDPNSHFHADTYCNPDWTGCSFVSSDYQSDPFGLNECSWAGLGTRFNFNCVGIGFTGLCTTYRLGECGRSALNIDPSQLSQILNNGSQINWNGKHGLLYNVNALTTQVTLSGNGQSYDLRLRGNLPVRYIPMGNLVLVDATGAQGSNLRNFAAKLKDINSATVRATMTFHGVSHDFNITGKGLYNQYLKTANALY